MKQQTAAREHLNAGVSYPVSTFVSPGCRSMSCDGGLLCALDHLRSDAGPQIDQKVSEEWPAVNKSCRNVSLWLWCLIGVLAPGRVHTGRQATSGATSLRPSMKRTETG